ncbi:SDR family oxidoreductase [Yinghuangia sp. ASG 101]|uniref:SDR family oxidoreductase n=1 Tax=Yinghuangia sp. ASG 101 TaxID=2896848 RepID=UPI001E42C2A3|nr:SDR family oxidoreductase [Yinghuangia sp. ASG 101]UGQ11744.1 SDR family oxidoreductase [Yinghuangia sp. ASG 101]
METIEGRTAFVTGAASGIGLAVAASLLGAGARVVVADRDRDALKRAADHLGATALAVHLDVTDRDGWHDAKRTAEEAFGPVDILVNNAGIAHDLVELADLSPEVFDRQMAVMPTGTFNGVHTFAGGMRDRGAGHIVNTASMLGLVANARFGAYSAAKFAVVGLTEALRAEMEPHGVGVSLLCPGLVRTNFGKNGDRGMSSADKTSSVGAGIDPALVGAQVRDAIRENRPYVMTHAEFGPTVARRSARLQSAFATAPHHGPGN